MAALNGFFLLYSHAARPISETDIQQIMVPLTHMVDCLFPECGDDEDFAGADTLDGVDYIHPVKVAQLAAVMGRHCGWPRSRLIMTALAATLMNVGYVALRRSVVDEPRQLVSGEWEQHVEAHPTEGVALLSNAGLPAGVMAAIAQHHERWDGSGYPKRLRAEQIVEEARFIAVADAYVSLRSYRPDRPRVDAQEALRILRDDSDAFFAPGLVDMLAELVAKYGAPRQTGRVTTGPQTSAAPGELLEAARRGPLAQERRESHTGRVREQRAAEEEATRLARRSPARTIAAAGESAATGKPDGPGSVTAETARVAAPSAHAGEPTGVSRPPRRRRGSMFATRRYVVAAMRAPRQIS
jgi:hypothetical protein